jgi:hypothetical protein
LDEKENIQDWDQDQLSPAVPEYSNVPCKSAEFYKAFLTRVNNTYNKLMEQRRKDKIKNQVVEPELLTPVAKQEENDIEKSCSNIFDDHLELSNYPPESPYISQRVKTSPRLSISTPLNDKVKKFDFETPGIEIENIAKEQEAENCQDSEESDSDTAENGDKHQSALLFCGLKSIDDLFVNSSDSSEGSQSIEQKPKNRFMQKLELMDEIERAEKENGEYEGPVDTVKKEIEPEPIEEQEPFEVNIH